MSQHTPDPEELAARLAEAEAELERLDLTLSVLGTVDLDSGIRNRNGLLEAMERARRWMSRRGDIYGLLVAVLPRFEVARRGNPGFEDYLEFVKHIAATIGAGVREVDEVGRIDDNTFAAVLADLAPGSIQVVANRVGRLLATEVASDERSGGEIRVGAVEVLNTSHTSGTVLDAASRLADQAPSGGLKLGQI